MTAKRFFFSPCIILLLLLHTLLIAVAIVGAPAFDNIHFSGRQIAATDFTHIVKLSRREAQSQAETTSKATGDEQDDHYFVLCHKHKLLSLEGKRDFIAEVHHIPQPIGSSSSSTSSHSAYLVFSSPTKMMSSSLLADKCVVRKMDPALDKISPELTCNVEEQSDNRPRSSLLGLYISISLNLGGDENRKRSHQQAERIAHEICRSDALIARCVVEEEGNHNLIRVAFRRMPTNVTVMTDGEQHHCSAHMQNLLHRIASHRHVRRIAPAVDFSFLNNVATLTVQSSADDQHHTRRVWNHGITGAGQLAAVADTGVDYDMCFFFDAKYPTPAFWPAVNAKHRKIVSYQPCVDGQYRVDHSDPVNAHGTHVAGSLVGERLDVKTTGDEVADAHDGGMAKGAKLFFSDLSCGESSGIKVPHNPYDVFVPAQQAGATVHSNSWGFDFGPKTSTYEAADRETDRFAFTHSDRFLIVFAAGNEPSHGVLKPGSAKNVLTVGAHINSLEKAARERMAAFSAMGPTYDQRLKPEISGPGASVASAASDGRPNTHNCGTISKSGTSMATPHVAGAAVLARQYFADGFYPYGWKGSGPAVQLPGAALKALLVTGAYPLSGVNPATTPNMAEGFGGLNLQEILFFDDRSSAAERAARKLRQLVVEEKEFVVSASNSNDNTKRQVEYCVTLHDGEASDEVLRDHLRVSLSWMDPPLAAEGSVHSLVNDLDLVVVRADGTPIFSNSRIDHSDKNANTEQVVIPLSSAAASEKNFLVIVRGELLETDTQEFSLVALGRGVNWVKRGGGSVAADSCSSFQCPKSCSGRGTCTGGVCKCGSADFSGADCALCDATVACHGNGQCSVAAAPSSSKITCQCDTHNGLSHFDTGADPMCGKCSAGYFGPSCISQCDCAGHGTCNQITGECTCFADAVSGFWDSSSPSPNTDPTSAASAAKKVQSCWHCAFDYTRVQSQFPNLFPKNDALRPAACASRSFWCTDRLPRAIFLNDTFTSGILQINDIGQYENSMTCVWRIETQSRSALVHLRFISFQIEGDASHFYDKVKLYSGAEMAKLGPSDVPGEEVRPTYVLTGNMQQVLATVKTQPVTSEGSVMYVVFESDFVGPQVGFAAEFTSLRTCGAQTCHGRGVCNSANGQCGCEGNFDQATDCASCMAGFTGAACTEKANSGGPTSVSATTRTPSPSSGGQPAPHDYHHVSQCYSVDGVECSGHGACNPGSGRCVCDAFHGGFLCEKPCPSFDGVLCGGGKCIAETATCDCTGAVVSGFATTLPHTLVQSALGGSTCQMLLDNVRHLSANNPVFGPAVVPMLRNQPGIVVPPLSGSEKTALDPRLRGTLGTPIFTVPWPEGESKSTAYISIFARRLAPPVVVANKKTSSSSSSSSSSQAADPLSIPFRVDAFRDWSVIGTQATTAAASDGQVEPDATWMSVDSGPICVQLRHRRPLNRNSKSSAKRLGVSIFAQTELLEVFILFSFDPTFKCGDETTTTTASPSSSRTGQSLSFLRSSLTILSDDSVTANQLMKAPPSDVAVIVGVSAFAAMVGAVLAAGRVALHSQARRKHRADRRRRAGAARRSLYDPDDDDDDEGQQLSPATGGVQNGEDEEDDDDEFVNDPIPAAVAAGK